MLCTGALQNGLGDDKKAKNWFISNQQSSGFHTKLCGVEKKNSFVEKID